MIEPTKKELCRIIAEQQALISELTGALNAADLALKKTDMTTAFSRVKK